jgi:hypothetical protein
MLSEKYVKMIFDFFISCINYIKQVVNYFRYRDYYIQKAEVLYTSNDVFTAEDITDEYRSIGHKKLIDEKSEDVTDFVFRIKYLFNHIPYVYLTRNPNHKFPPVKNGVSFILPIKEAILLDANDVPVYDVTNHVKMYAGPNGDFHGETIRLRDIYEIEYPKLRLTNVLGITVDYDTNDEISHPTLWSPSKTSSTQD